MAILINRDQIERHNISDHNVQFVIIRLDYTGVIDEDEFFLELVNNQEIDRNDYRRQEVYRNEMSIQLSAEDLQTISDSVRIPVNVLERMKMIRLAKTIMHNENKIEIVIDISRCFTCFTLQFNDIYPGLDVVLDSVKLVTDIIISQKHISVKRFGLRKNRIELFDDKDAIYRNLEKSVWGSKDNKYLSKPLFKDSMEVVQDLEDDSLLFNIKRIIQPIVFQENQRQGYRAILDIDAHCDDETALQSIKDYSRYVQKVNDRQFNLYKSMLTLDYLNSISHD